MSLPHGTPRSSGFRGGPAQAAALSVAANALLLALKVTVGLLSGSIAILSDGLDSAEDLVASGAAWLAIGIGARPADYDHPYGHGKVESLSAALEAGVISMGGAFIAYNAIGRLVHGGGEIALELGLGTMAAVVAPDKTIADVHRLCDGIEADVKKKLPGSTVVIHMEPDDGRPLEPLA